MTLLRDLERAVGASLVTGDPDVIAAASRDHARWVPAGTAAALVRPRTAADVAAAVRVAAAHGAPVVPRGAGSGLSGGANAVDGCVLLQLTGMDRIVDLSPQDGIAVVQPGLLNGDLKAAAAAEGLSYPPDPASAAFSSIGGNVATDAGGLCCVRHGSTRHWVRGLEVVLADGVVVRTGGRSHASSAGYDLTGLFVGSEGTLGVITEVVVRLAPAAPPQSTLVASFAELEAAAEAVVAIMRATTPTLLEVMDRACIAAVNAMARMELDEEAAALLLVQTEQDPSGIEKACLERGATYVAVTADADESELLLNARRLVCPALERQGATMLDDVGVPRSRLAELLRACAAIGERQGVTVATFGHAGVGTLHPTLVFDADDAEEVARARQAFADIVAAALALGGTVTGEHGVGRLKTPFLADELDPTAHELQRRIRAVLDPRGLFNPGAAL